MTLPRDTAPLWRTAIVAGALACGAIGISAQDQGTPTFRSGVEVVEIDAAVVDGQGQPVTGLRAEDFEILENGKAHAIVSFAAVDLPIEPSNQRLLATPPIEPDVQSNEVTAEGRVYLFALDEVSGPSALKARRLLRRYIEQHFAANDLGAVMLLGRARTADNQYVTGNRRLLLQAIDRFTPGFGSSAGGGMPLCELTGEPLNELWIRTSMLHAAIDLLAQVPGRRKSVFYVSEGFGATGIASNVIDVRGGGMCNKVADELHAAMTVATRSNIAFYPIDPRGLLPGGGTGDDESAPSSDGAAAAIADRESLRALGDLTGGFAILNTNDFDEAFDRVVRDNSSYYLLGYSSSNTKRDGRFRQIEVRVKRPGLRVRARSGYIAPFKKEATPRPANHGKISTAIADALMSPVPVRGVPLRVTAAAFRGTDNAAHVVVAMEMDAGQLGLVERNGTYNARIEAAVASAAAGATGSNGFHHVMELALKPKTFTSASKGSVRVLLQLELGPGRHQLRAAAGNTAGPAGSAVLDLEVPDFAKLPLSMSGAVITTVNGEREGLTIKPQKLTVEGLPEALITTREFAPGDRLALYLEIYEKGPAAAHLIDFTTELHAEGGRVVSGMSEQRSSTEVRSKSGGYAFAPIISLGGVEPGVYVLHLRARANAGDRPTVSRDIRIQVK